MARAAAFVLVLLGLVGAAAAKELRLQLEVDKQTGHFTIALGERQWLAGSEYRLGALSSTAGGGLKLAEAASAAGSDKLGAYRATILSWARAGAPDEVLMRTSFREYAEDPSFIVFEQQFPRELSLQSFVAPAAKSPLGTVFPGFDLSLSGAAAAELPGFSNHEMFGGVKPCTLRNYTGIHQGGAPLVVYNSTDLDLPMVALSPLTNPMATHLDREGILLGMGLMPTIELVPAGWSQLFVLSAGAGINRGMMAWGDHMLKVHGVSRMDNRYRDDVHGGIGFWTDNGGYYHYSIGNNKSLGSNYEEVLVKVKAWHDEIGVPFKHWQFDSWFYPKDGAVQPGGGGPAVLNWTADPSIFPHGMQYIQSKLKVPMAMHNRHWSSVNVYVRQWPDIEWHMSNTTGLPKDPEEFFRRFFQLQEGWGLAMYEQDWMSLQYDKTDALKTNISLGTLWLRGMADGAARTNRTVQYCMPWVNEILTAAAFPAVTNVRASGDYRFSADRAENRALWSRNSQWAIGASSMMLWALNKLPFKDGFLSSNLKQPGGEEVGPELDPDRQALISVLSAAMVAPMDGIYFLNASRVMATCRKDGIVLKPDRPLTTTDACFRRKQPLCWVYHTLSEVPGLGAVHYYYNDDGAAPMLAEEVYVDPGAGEFAVYNWYTRAVSRLGGSNKLDAGYEGHIYATVMPVLGGWAFLGEVDKYVTASTLRFRSVRAAAGGVLIADVAGVAGETVRVCAARAPAFEVSCNHVHFAEQLDAHLVKTITFGDELSAIQV